METWAAAAGWRVTSKGCMVKEGAVKIFSVSPIQLEALAVLLAISDLAPYVGNVRRV